MEGLRHALRGTGGLLGLLAVTAIGLLAGCANPAPATKQSTSSSASSPARSVAVQPGTTGVVELGSRAFGLHVPRTNAPGSPAPLVVLLHGYTGTAGGLASDLALIDASDSRGFLLALPEGTRDTDGKPFWNATQACCNFYGSDVDDSGYLSQVIATVSDRYAVDPRKVFVIGHSNGGFMAHRLACDHADQIAAIVSLAGAQSAEPASCHPSRPVSVLQVHGTADDTILFGGGAIDGHPYPSAIGTVSRWRALDHCTPGPGTIGSRLDADASLAGAETARTSWSHGCADGTAVALWTVVGAGHTLDATPAFTAAVIDWLEAHSRKPA